MKGNRARIPSVLAVAALLAIPFASEATAFSLGETRLRWQNRGELRFCWIADLERFSALAPRKFAQNHRLSPAPRKLRERVKSLVEANFPSSLTGIAPTGFAPCPSPSRSGAGTPDSDVLLANDLLIPGFGGPIWGRASIGDERPAYWPKEKTFHAAVGFNFREPVETAVRKSEALASRILALLPDGPASARRAERIRRFARDVAEEQIDHTVLHEFGHLFGLLHEDLRYDWFANKVAYSFCEAAVGLPDEASSSGQGEASRLGTRYDPFSVMHSCRAEMIELHHAAQLLCSFETPLRRSERVSPTLARSLRPFLDRCAFVRANRLPMALSAGDRTGLRRLYASGTADPGEFREPPGNPAWIATFTRLHAFIRALNGN